MSNKLRNNFLTCFFFPAKISKICQIRKEKNWYAIVVQWGSVLLWSFFLFGTSISAIGLINLLYGSGADGDYHTASSDSFIVPDFCHSQCVSLRQELCVNFRVDHELTVVSWHRNLKSRESCRKTQQFCSQLCWYRHTVDFVLNGMWKSNVSGIDVLE